LREVAERPFEKWNTELKDVRQWARNEQERLGYKSVLAGLLEKVADLGYEIYGERGEMPK
jgi:hypothetical protein